MITTEAHNSDDNSSSDIFFTQVYDMQGGIFNMYDRCLSFAVNC